MNDDKTGGAAFPPAYNLTLRDYFAAKAMASMMVRGDEYKNAHARKLMGEMAYTIADAMLAARKGDK